ncbi:hypothetical protein PU088_004075 [Citrobacter farmeri]|uniref:hypothetical protein n=1 Tax=Citrobacter amalonaticus TaxID=35703 RepID=UPI000AFE93FF|nr:hypothetical protein [Citrobacter amalonaticus]EKV5656528.1 hypothetical protein [Citrobacter farmeri]
MTTYRTSNRYVKKALKILLMIAPVLVTGCQQHSQSELVTGKNAPTSVVSSSLPSPQITPAAPKATSVEVSEGAASACQKELIALSKVNQNQYAKKKAAFEQLLDSASVYTSVREDIGSQTRDTMDALYKYKTQKLCSDIEQTVRQSLINRGEGFK